MATTYNSVLVHEPPFFRAFRDGKVLIRDASSLPFILEEVVSYGAVDIAIPARSLSSLALDSVSDVLKRRVRVIDEDFKIWEMDRTVREPIRADFGLRYFPEGGEAMTFDEKLPSQVERAVLRLEHDWYDFLLGLTFKLQIDVGITELRRSIEILRENAKTPETRAILATFAGVLSTYRTHEVGVIEMVPRASERLVEVFQAFLEDSTYLSMSRNFHELGFPQRLKAGLSRVGTLAKRLVRKSAFKKVVGLGSKSITAATQIPLPEADLGERLLEKKYLPPIITLGHAVEKAHRAWSGSGVDFTPLDSQ